MHTDLIRTSFLPIILTALACSAACVEQDEGVPPCAAGSSTGADGLPGCEPAPDERVPAAVVDESPALATDRVGHPPTPGLDRVTTPEDVVVYLPFGDLLANDTDPDDDPIFVDGLGDSVFGTAVVTGRKIAFTPAPDFHGTAAFEYLVSDGRMDTAGQVIVTVLPVGDAPVAASGRIELAVDQGAVFTLKAADVDGDPITVELVEAPAHGKLTVTAGKYLYQPDDHWWGADRLIYRAFDGELWSAPAAITFVVRP